MHQVNPDWTNSQFSIEIMIVCIYSWMGKHVRSLALFFFWKQNPFFNSKLFCSIWEDWQSFCSLRFCWIDSVLITRFYLHFTSKRGQGTRHGSSKGIALFASISCLWQIRSRVEILLNQLRKYLHKKHWFLIVTFLVTLYSHYFKLSKSLHKIILYQFIFWYLNFFC